MGKELQASIVNNGVLLVLAADRRWRIDGLKIKSAIFLFLKEVRVSLMGEKC